MRKQLVYHYKLIAERLEKIRRSTPPKTYLYAKIQLNIAFNNLRLALFDPSGVYSAYYELDRFNELKKRHHEK